MSGMKSKTVRKIIVQKMEDWIQTVDNLEVQKAIRKDAIVTGGAIASMLLGEKINDFDVYFRTKETAAKVALYYIGKFEFGDDLVPEVQIHDDENRVRIYIASQGIVECETNISEPQLQDNGEVVEAEVLREEQEKTDEKPKYRPIFFSENAITLSNRLQIVTRFCGEPDEIHNNYDFVHAMNYYDLGKRSLVLKPEAMEALLSKTLIYRGSLYPICSLFRLRKFISRGWKVTAGEILKISWQISELNLKDINVLRDQLTGVDALYFRILMEALEKVDTSKLSSSYVTEMIDRVFND